MGLRASIVIAEWLTIILLQGLSATMKSELKGVSRPHGDDNEVGQMKQW